tara:strand:- start:78 stop:848 length:771 start_codon:yes stop_codon:yes gene_type:complete
MQEYEFSFNVFPSPEEASVVVAKEIAGALRSRSSENVSLVFGLATGSTPIPVYEEWVRLHNQEGLSFKNAKSFNLDEYLGLEPTHPESYQTFMEKNLFSKIDILPENAIVPNGMMTADVIPEYCQCYETQIKEVGGIDIQILGIGRSGHIGFNEPGSSIDSLTRLVALDDVTREDAADDFGGKNNVPTHALTMGVGTILSAKKIYLLAWGKAKSAILADALRGPICESVPASFIRNHPDVNIFVDEDAGQILADHL